MCVRIYALGTKIDLCRTGNINNKYTSLWSQTRNEESVVCITRRMLLWLEKCIEVPKATFNKVVGWHLSETVQNNTSEIW